MKRSKSIEDLFESSESDDPFDPLDRNSGTTPGTDGPPDTSGVVYRVDCDPKESYFSDNSSANGPVNFVRKYSTELLQQTRAISAENVGPVESMCSKSEPVAGKPVCHYGKLCYRKNPSHFTEFSHPDGSIHCDNVSSSSLSPSKRQSDTTDHHRHVRSFVAESLEDSQPFSFFLTKVRGIKSKHNSKGAIGIKDILSENLGKLQKSAQFNYCIDIPWLISKYPKEFRKKPLLIVHGDKGEDKLTLQEDASRYNNVRLCQAPLDFAFGTHHTKMMLLLYDDGLRVVIHTANLVDNDWDQKTQGVWISPLFPKLAAKGIETGDSSTNFKRDLIEYLSAYRQRSLEEWISIVRQSDMSSAKVVLIGSVPGRHIGEKISHFGHFKLRKALQNYGPEASTVSDWSVVGQFSSVGSLGASSDAWLTSEWLTSLSSVQGFSSAKAKLQLVFPSMENVRCSLEGYSAGDALPYSIDTAMKQPYFTSFLHQWRSDCRGRTRASPHIKTYARVSADGKWLAWFLLTSANMSKAAWGSLEKNGSQLFIRSYELGVLFLPQNFDVRMFTIGKSLSDENEEVAECDSLPFPFPFDLPPLAYEKDDQPWICDIPY